MNNPRNTDTRRQDYQFGDPLRRREQSVDSMWGWLVGLAVVLLIAFIVIVGWSSSGPTTASNTPPQIAPAATTTGQGPAMRPAPLPAPGQGARTPLDLALPANAPESGTK